MEQEYSVTDTGYVIVRYENRFKPQAVDHSGKHDETAMTAYCCLIEEVRFEVHELGKFVIGDQFDDPLIVLNAFFGKSVRTVFLKLMRKIAAGNNDYAAVKRIDRFADSLAELKVIFE